MSKFSNLSIDNIILELKKHPSAINDFDYTNMDERNKVCSVIKQEPELFPEIKEKYLFDDLCIEYLSASPYLYDTVPKLARTQAVKDAIVKLSPSVIELFDEDEFDYETVKHLWVTQPYLLEELDDEKANKRVGGIISSLKKDGVVQEYDEKATPDDISDLDEDVEEDAEEE